MEMFCSRETKAWTGGEEGKGVDRGEEGKWI